MPEQNRMYNALEERVSMVQILRNGKEIFYGEVREISEITDKIKSVYCVGELAFLFDSIQPQARYQGHTPEQLLITMVNIHNAKVEEKKRFKVGIVTVTDPNNSLYRFTNGEDTLTAIRKKLCEPLNGYLRIRKVEGERYLDLVRLEDYGVSAEQPIQFGRNLLKYSSKKSGSSIITVCVPRGARLETQVIEGLDAYTDITSVNDGKNYVINEEAFKHYGWIEKLVSWDDVTVPENLKTKAQEWVDNNQYKTLSLELKAVDLAELNANIEPYSVGDTILAIAEPFGMSTWFPLMKKVTYLNDAITNDVTLSYETKVPYTQQQNNKYQEIENALPQETDLLIRARENTSEIIKSVSEGNVYFVYDENSRIKEILFLDTNDINTAQKVWRWNINGFGYSSTGYDGEYKLAMTMDGAFVADFITTGVLNANLIRAGTIQDVKGNNFWNMETGEFQLASTVKVGKSTVASKQDATDAAKNAADALNDSLDMEEIFNRLTSDGTVKGIYLIDGQLYVNASYVKSGTLSLGDENNGNGCIEMFNASGEMVGEWGCDGFVTRTDTYTETEYLPKYFENNYYDYPYYHEENSWGVATGDYVASYIIELADTSMEHTVYVKFKNPNRNTANTESVEYYDDSVIYEYTAVGGKVILTVANWFSAWSIRDDMEYLYDTYGTESMWFNDVEKIWSPTSGIKRVTASTGGNGSGVTSAVKYSFDNEAVQTSVTGMKIDMENGAIKSDHYSIGEDGINYQLDKGYISADILENTRINRLNLSKQGIFMSAFEFDANNNMAEYKFMEFLTSLYEAGIKFRSPHITNSPEAYFGVAGIENTAVYKTTTSSGSNVRIDSAGKFYRYASSSKRYKKDITAEIKEELNPEKLYDLEVVQYKYNDDYLEENDQRYGKDFIGFIAEQVAEIYPLACNMDEQNRPEMWEIIILFPPLLKLVQEQKKEIDSLKDRLTKLEERLGGENG